MRTRYKPAPDLGAFLLKWRKENGLTMEEAADRAGISKSTWSALENVQRGASMQRLYGLQCATGAEYDDLARLAGHEVRRSVSIDERARRIAAMSENLPKTRALIDLLEHLDENQTDVLLSAAENFSRNRQSHPKAHRKGQK